MESEGWDLKIYFFHRTVLLVLTWQREEELCSADLSLCWMSSGAQEENSAQETIYCLLVWYGVIFLLIL